MDSESDSDLEIKFSKYTCLFNMKIDKFKQSRLKEIKSKLQDELDVDIDGDDETIQKLNFYTWVEYKLDNMVHAISLNQQAIEFTKQTNVISLVNKGYILWYDGRQYEADKYIHKVDLLMSGVEAPKKKTEINAELAYSLSRIGGPLFLSHAIKLYEKIVDFYPNEFSWKYRLGLAHRRAVHGNVFATLPQKLTIKEHVEKAANYLFDVALNCSETCLRGRAYSQLAILHNNSEELVGHNCSDIFQKKTVKELIDCALEHGPNDARTLFECGRILRFHDLDRAIELLEKSLSLRKHSTTLHHLGRCYEEKAKSIATDEHFKNRNKNSESLGRYTQNVQYKSDTVLKKNSSVQRNSYNSPAFSELIPNKYNSPRDMNPQSYNSPRNMNPLRYNSPRNMNPLRYNSPRNMNPLRYNSPRNMNPLRYNSPRNMNPLRYNSPRNMNPLRYNSPRNMNPLNYDSPENLQMFIHNNPQQSTHGHHRHLSETCDSVPPARENFKTFHSRNRYFRQESFPSNSERNYQMYPFKPISKNYSNRLIRCPLKIRPLKLDDVYVQKAKESYVKSLQISFENNIPALYDLGLLMRACTEYDQALEHFNKITRNKESIFDHMITVICAYEQCGLCQRDMLKSTNYDGDDSQKKLLLRRSDKCLLQAVTLAAHLAKQSTDIKSHYQDIWNSFRILESSYQEENDSPKIVRKLITLLQTASKYDKIPEVIERLKTLDETALSDPHIIEAGIEAYLAREDFESALTFLSVAFASSENIGFSQQLGTLNIKVNLLAAEARLHTDVFSARFIFKLLFNSSVKHCQIKSDHNMTQNNMELTDVQDDNHDDILILFDDKSRNADLLSEIAKSLKRCCGEIFGMDVYVNIEKCSPGLVLVVQLEAIKASSLVLVLLEEDTPSKYYKGLLELITCALTEETCFTQGLVGLTSHGAKVPPVLKTLNTIQLEPLLENLAQIPYVEPLEDIAHEKLDEGFHSKALKDDSTCTLKNKEVINSVMVLYSSLIGQKWPISQ